MSFYTNWARFFSFFWGSRASGLSPKKASVKLVFSYMFFFTVFCISRVPHGVSPWRAPKMTF